MMMSFVDVFSMILSSSKMELEEHLLFGGWIDRYLIECPSRVIGTLTGILVNVFEKCTSSDVSSFSSGLLVSTYISPVFSSSCF